MSPTHGTSWNGSTPTCQNHLDEVLVKDGWILITRSGTVGRTALVSANMVGSAVSEHVIRVVPGSDINPGYLYAAIASEYGYYQATRYIHGSVVDELTTDQTDAILIPLPDRTDEMQIGDLVLDAVDMRVRANALLRRARALFDAALTTGQPSLSESRVANWLVAWEQKTKE